MDYTRRKFMKAGVLAAACAGLPLKQALGHNGTGVAAAPLFGKAASGAAPSSSSIEQLGYYSKAAFTPYVNTNFQVYLEASNTRGLQLSQIGDYLSSLSQTGAGANTAGAECFSLLFTMPPGHTFQQDTYMIEHDALGTFYMFLTPVSSKGQTTDYYESVIYRRPDTMVMQAPTRNPENTTEGMPQPARGPWRVSDAQGERDVYNFSSLMPVPKIEERPALIDATWVTKAQDRGINGLKLGMTLEQVLALFPGSKDDEEVRANLADSNNQLGLSNLIIRPEKFTSKAEFEGISQISLTLLDNRVSTLYVGYDAPQAGHLDEFVSKFAKGRKLPPAKSWATRVGLDDKLKTMKCKDFEIKVFAGGNNVNINYVQMVDTVAQQKLKERQAKLKKAKP